MSKEFDTQPMPEQGAYYQHRLSHVTIVVVTGRVYCPDLDKVMVVFRFPRNPDVGPIVLSNSEFHEVYEPCIHAEV